MMKPHQPITQTPSPSAARGLALPALLLAFSLLTGCSSMQWTVEDAPPPRAAGYAALYDLMNRNSGVGKLLVFKTVDPPVKLAIDDFAQQCAMAAKQLKQFALDDDSIDLNAHWLTPIEKQTRDGIESATSTALLTTFGKQFQTHLLLSQTSAAEYASHLAHALAKLEDNKDRNKYLTDLSDQLAKTHMRLFNLIEPAQAK